MKQNAVYYDVASDGSHKAYQDCDVSELCLEELEVVLGGPLEVLQLDETHCLLTNALAREKSEPKNKRASQLWFEKHPVSGHGADFILGPVIYCENAQIAHLNYLHAEVKPVLTAAQRAEKAALILAAERLTERNQQQEQEQAALVCTMEEGCVMCGS